MNSTTVNIRQLRAGLREVLAQVVETHEPAVITRSGEEIAVLVSDATWQAVNRERAALAGELAQARSQIEDLQGQLTRQQEPEDQAPTPRRWGDPTPPAPGRWATAQPSTPPAVDLAARVNEYLS
jgi:prevent-host-death family protein